MRLKRPALASIGIDIDAAAIANFSITTIPDLTICINDGITWLETHGPYLDSNTLIYCDPPYLLSTRSHRKIYRYELTDAEHIHLLEVINHLPCMIAISGYPSDLYSWHLSKWRCLTYQAQTRGGKPKSECLWMNYPEPTELHDYRYLGSSYRERERIKRLQQRWTNKLNHMNRLERLALISVLTDHNTISIDTDQRSVPPAASMQDPARATTTRIDDTAGSNSHI